MERTCATLVQTKLSISYSLVHFFWKFVQLGLLLIKLLRFGCKQVHNDEIYLWLIIVKRWYMSDIIYLIIFSCRFEQDTSNSCKKNNRFLVLYYQYKFWYDLLVIIKMYMSLREWIWVLVLHQLLINAWVKSWREIATKITRDTWNSSGR